MRCSSPIDDWSNDGTYADPNEHQTVLGNCKPPFFNEDNW